MNEQYVKASLKEAQVGLDALINNEAMIGRIAAAGHLIAQSQMAGGSVFSCGNGGSLCDAMHFAEEMTGRYRKNRQPFRAVAIADASHMACVANDFGYLDVFSRWVEAFGKPTDVLLAISTSGKSANILKAALNAKEKGMKVIVLTGKDATELTDAADVAIVTPAGYWADRVQELHIKVIHILIELIERELAPENYSE